MAGESTISIDKDGNVTIKRGGGQGDLNLPPEAQQYLPPEAVLPPGPPTAAFPDVGAEPALPLADYSASLPQPMNPQSLPLSVEHDNSTFGAPGVGQLGSPRAPLPLPTEELLSLFSKPRYEAPASLLSSPEGAGAGGALAIGDVEAAKEAPAASDAPVSVYQPGPVGKFVSGIGQYAKSTLPYALAPVVGLATGATKGPEIAPPAAPATTPEKLGAGPGVAPDASPAPAMASPATGTGAFGILQQKVASGVPLDAADVAALNAASPEQQASLVMLQVANKPIPSSYSAPTPAATIPTNYSLTEGRGPTPETQQAIQGGYDQLAATSLTNAAAQQAALARAGLAHLQAADAADAEMARLRQDQETKQRYVDTTMRDLDTRIEGVRRLSQDNPVERYWTKKGALGTVAAKIGIALGALGSAVTGGPNQVYQQVKDEIEQEVDHQKVVLDSEHASLKNRFNLLAEMRATMLSPEAAENATRALLLESAAAEARAQAAMVQSVEARAAGLKLADELALEASKLRGQTEVALQDTTKWIGKYRPATAGGYSPGRLPTAEERIARLKGLGATFDQALMGTIGQYSPKAEPGSARMANLEWQQQKDARERSVDAPPDLPPWLAGTVQPGYVKSPLMTKETTNNINDLAVWGRMVDRMDEILAKPTWYNPLSGQQMSRREAKKLLQQDMMAILKRPVIKEANTVGETPMREKLFAADAGDLIRYGEQDKALIGALREGIKRRMEQEASLLSPDPNAPLGSGTKPAPLPSSAVSKE